MCAVLLERSKIRSGLIVLRVARLCGAPQRGYHFPSDDALLNATTWHGTTLPNYSIYAVIDLRCLY